MTARRALVVDDSRSARAFLTRILERNDLAVDAVESAEQAIEYLTQQRPDVIFMDHLMPGMDGFQALQAIKNNPRTATIPIMMYTSQEGELYLSQARALGAIGVLPKQIKHADVSKALEQLKLGPEIKADSAPITVQVPILATDSAPPLDMTMERRAPDRPDFPAMPPELRTIMESMLSHHGRELRRFVVDTLESQADRIIGDLRLLMQDAAAEPAGEAPRERGRRLVPWLAAAGLLLAAVFAVLWWQMRGDSAALTARLNRSQQQLTQTQHSLQSLQAADAAAAAAAASAAAPIDSDTSQQTSLIEPVPFGETPLAGARLERVSELLARLSAQGFHGVVQIRSIPGRYCMMNGPGGSAALASDASLYSRCEQIGNPRDEDDTASGRQSIAFANMISTARAAAGGKFDIQISAGGADEVATPYPPVTDTLTAGEWNRVAAANNRVELHWQVTH